MSYAKKLLILGIMVVIIGALLYFAPTIISSVQKSINSPNSSSNPQLGTEIKNYPLDGLSFTVTSWWFATTAEALPNVTGVSVFDPPSGSVYVVINFTFRNIGDTEIDFGPENYWNLASVTLPLLQYGDYYAQANPNRFYSTGLPLYLGQPVVLMPNQTTNGALFYQILQGYTPSRLLYPNKDSPTFVINLSS